MPDNENNGVFNRRTQTHTTTEVPAPGTDNHVTIDGSNSVWNGITNAPFIKDLSGGQEQQLVLSSDHVVQVQHNQIVKIQLAQNTTAQQEITITSAENQIYLKAATQIVLEVGKSRITMTADGRIEIAGVEIALVGDFILSSAARQNTIIGKRVDINLPIS